FDQADKDLGAGMEEHAQDHSKQEPAFLGHLRLMAIEKIIRTRKQAMRSWAVLHKTTTKKDKGSIMGVRERECERE
ncbi:MAG: hypothetical protein ACKODZ_05210, partial [Verrucomicrobiota bacterium]